MKNNLFILILACFTSSAFCQNLIPNSGFEEHSVLPSSLGQFDLCDHWGNTGSLSANPDYYHLNGSLIADLPITSVAEVLPVEGKAIMGFKASGRSGTNIREYLSVKLLTPTIPGKKYRVSFKIANGTAFAHSKAGLGVDKIGVKFSENPLSQNADDPIVETPVYETEEVIYTKNWRTIGFNFIAEDACEWLTFGVFGDDLDKSIDFFHGNSTLAEFAYYFVDDFEMINIPLAIQPSATTDEYRSLGEEEKEERPPLEDEFPLFVPNAFTPDGDGNNEFFTIISGSHVLEFTVSVFDRWGGEIYTAKNGQPAWGGYCKGAPCPSDIYVWLVRYSVLDRFGKEKQIEETGTIHLLR